jgi:hypothetical protein
VNNGSNLRRTNDAVLELVARLQNLSNGVGFLAGVGDGEEGVMKVRVKVIT